MTLTLPDYSGPNLQDTTPTHVPTAPNPTDAKPGVLDGLFWPINIGEFLVVPNLHVGVSENVVYPKKPNGFADHYPYEKWLFHWEY